MKVDPLAIIFISSIAGFNYIWIFNRYVIWKIGSPFYKMRIFIREIFDKNYIIGLSEENRFWGWPTFYGLVLWNIEYLKQQLKIGKAIERFDVSYYLTNTKTLYIAAVILIILLIINFIPGTKDIYYIYLIQIIAINYVFWSSYMLLSYNLKSNFRYLFARTCISIATDKSRLPWEKAIEDEVDKLRYLILGLNSYNKFIRQKLGLKINNLKGIYSKISCLSDNDRKSELDLVYQSFDTNDKFGPLNHLSSFLGIKTEEFLTKESLRERIKGEWIPLFVSVVPVVISIFQLLIPNLGK
jgi:hypothetical protein